MKLELIRATAGDAEELWKMQRAAFAQLLEKYQDFDTSPGNEPLEKVQMRLKQPFTYFYFICVEGEKAGAIRVVDPKEVGQPKRISPLFLLPAYRGQGIAQKVIQLCEHLHGETGWALDTILQEAGNRHLYEKMGYRATGKTEQINDKMTLIFYEKE
ncbi:MAG: GNAT family N-acetyltransferase [Clostridiales bacterium]|nr:GNAT family N-acetyltransferase [Clostridiales bacterium]